MQYQLVRAGQFTAASHQEAVIHQAGISATILKLFQHPYPVLIVWIQLHRALEITDGEIFVTHLHVGIPDTVIAVPGVRIQFRVDFEYL